MNKWCILAVFLSYACNCVADEQNSPEKYYWKISIDKFLLGSRIRGIVIRTFMINNELKTRRK